MHQAPLTEQLWKLWHTQFWHGMHIVEADVRTKNDSKRSMQSALRNGLGEEACRATVSCVLEEQLRRVLGA